MRDSGVVSGSCGSCPRRARERVSAARREDHPRVDAPARHEHRTLRRIVHAHDRGRSNSTSGGQSRPPMGEAAKRSRTRHFARVERDQRTVARVLHVANAARVPGWKHSPSGGRDARVVAQTAGMLLATAIGAGIGRQHRPWLVSTLVGRERRASPAIASTPSTTSATTLSPPRGRGASERRNHGDRRDRSGSGQRRTRPESRGSGNGCTTNRRTRRTAGTPATMTATKG